MTPTEYGGLPAGTSCEVTETDTGETTAIAVETTGTGNSHRTRCRDSVQATVTNTYTFRTGVLAVRKMIDGAAAGQQGPVTLNVVCTGASTLNETITIPAGATETDPVEYAGPAAGTVCTVTETANGSSTEIGVVTVFDPTTGYCHHPGGDGVEVTVTNTYTVNPGSLTVTKTIAGAAAGEQGDVADRHPLPPRRRHHLQHVGHDSGGDYRTASADVHGYPGGQRVRSDGVRHRRD